MDFDDAKENIQPLASGRNAERLEIALNAESHHEIHEQIMEQRREFERAIDSYDGDDPLDIWYDYIQWIEQSYPKSGKETALNEVIASCLSKFEHDERYKQDRRMIKLFIKYIDSEPNPPEYYELMYNNGIGTMVADLYMCWAHYYDYNDNYEKADGVYQKGLDARAQPLDQLEQAHKQFGFSMSQRVLHKDATTREKFLLSMDEQRLALTSLRAHKHRHVGSIRTGTAVKSYNPGRVEQQPHSSRTPASNRPVEVFEDVHRNTNQVMAGLQTPVRGAVGGAEHHQSIVQTILSSAKKHENSREPGPWSNAKLKMSRSIVGSSVNQKLPFDIMKDDDLIPLPDEQNMFKRGIHLPTDFVTKNLPQAEFEFPLHRDDDKNSNAMAGYDKFMLFPSADKCYSLEELWAYKWWKKRNISNDFTRAQDAIWGNGYGIPVRLPPYFRNRNEKQTDLMELEPFNPLDVVADGSRRFAFNIDHIYTAENEYSMEELLQARWLNGELVSQRESEMELTCAFNRRESVWASHAQRRSMALGGRKSILPAVTDAPRKSILRKSVASSNDSPTYSVQPSTSRASTQADDDHEASNKRKSSKIAFVSDQEMKSPPQLRRKFDEEQTAGAMHKFEIFHDDKESAVRDDKDLFKAPNPPPVSRPRVSSAFDLGDDNEGCTTQTFNFFIKSQSVSTPKANSKSAQCLSSSDIQPRSDLFAENEPSTSTAVRQPFTSRMPSEDESSANYPSPELETNRHKLSAILETTEDTNTISSAATISSKSSSVDELRTICEANSNVDSITSTTVASANKTPPLATIDEMRIVDKLVEVSPKAQQPGPSQEADKNQSINECKATKTAEASVASVLPFDIYEDNSLHFADNHSVSKAAHEEPPSVCPLNLIEDRTETIPPFLMNRNQTIEANSIMPLAEPTIQIPLPIDESMKLPSTMIPMISDRSQFAIFEDEAAVLSYPDCKQKLKDNETIDKSVFNFINDQSVMPPPEPLSTTAMSTELTDLVQKMNLSSKSTLLPRASIVDRSEFNIFQDENDKSMAPPVPDEVSSMSMFAIASAVQSNSETNDTQLQMSDKNESQRAAISSENVLGLAAAVSLPKISCAKTDIDDEFYRMMQSPDTRFPKSVAVPPKISIVDESYEKESVANDHSISLLRPMKEISINEHQRVDRSAVPMQAQLMNPARAEFTFSEENPNTELFSVHLGSIKNSTLLERGPSPMPSITNQPKSDAKAEVASNGSQETKNVTSLDDEFYAMIRSPVPPTRSKSLNQATQQVNEGPNENKCSSFDDKFYALINSPILPMAQASFSKVTSSQTNSFFEISGVELNEAEMKLMRKGRAECASDLSFPKIQMSAPKTIRPSEFNRMTAHFTILDSPEASVHKAEPSNIGLCKRVIDDSSVLIVDPTEDLSAIVQQCPKEQSNVNESGASFRRRNQSMYERKGNVSIDYSQSQQIDPFNIDVQHAFLSDIDFVDYISKLDNVYMVNRARALQPNTEIAFGDKEFHIIQQIGQGSFGFVYSGKCLSTKKMYAFKQERPANLWEFYISLELRSRIENENILAGFLVIDFALIGSNSSIFASEYCTFGSVIDVCNKHKEKTFRNLDELIVMILANQMLMIVDHMHGSNIIHGDIKPDNFLLMNKLDYANSERITLKLIDYGQSIDLNFYGQRQTFRTKLETKNFVCTEMLEDKSWTFQIDLFCVASTIYSMLCGKYMNIAKMSPNILHAYTLSEPLPAHLDTQLWMNVMHTLINVRDCDSMPDLQSLRLTIKEAIHVRERFLAEKIRNFNAVIG